MLFLFFACASAPEGLLATPDGSGPVVIFDWDAHPIANIPFPSDLATRPDPTSITGLRLNVPALTHTLWESEARAGTNELTGFGTYMPITVAFDAPLDLDVIAAAHRDDPNLGEAQFADDVVLVIDVDPDSPGYGKLAEMDLGHGRFPMDVPNPARYFANDTRSDGPSLVFDTKDEDTNGNGALDWGEDTDNDGLLDVPNVYPLGGDPRADLLTWYEYSSNTLILRPVVPLREETTYAVVLTRRLVDADGEAVRSPFAYVHHTRQTAALEPLQEILPDLGLSMDEVAFAWTFSTGRVTGDMRDLYRGLKGDGPYAALQQDVAGGINEALAMHEISDVPDVTRLPVEDVIGALVDLGLFDDDAADFLYENYLGFADVVVGGSFLTPNLLTDKDDGGTWDADERWSLDPLTGEVVYEQTRVVFTCVLPRATAEAQPPFDVASFGHGYGSSRFEFLAFAWAMNRVGMAACSFDFPGHGPTLDEDTRALAEAYLGTRGLLPFLTHLEDSRFRDLNNDGIPDSGGDQWTADAFHTRDMVRQAALDWMSMVRGVQLCGTGTMTRPDGSEAVSCDWDGDGQPDIGGPDARFRIAGGSLGGINAGVAAAVIPEVDAWAPVVPGGGLVDVAARTEIGGAVEAMVGRLISPIFIGTPTGDGGLTISQLVVSVTDMVQLPVATLPSFPAGGRVVLENLDNGDVREGWIPEDGTFRLPISADGLDPGEKRLLVGMPESGPAFGETYEVPDNEGLGDRLVLRLYDGAGQEVAVVETFETEVTHEGVTMAAGSPLIAGSFGAGHIRGTPEMRRVTMAFATLVEPGDPIAYAPHYTIDPFEDLGGVPANVLLMPTPGDTIVSVNTGIALARAAGLIDRETVRADLGMTEDQFLIARGVVSGLEEWGPYTCANGLPCLFDADDQDNGTDETGATSESPVRATVQREDGVGGLRLPYADQTGSHGFGEPEPNAAFDINTFAIMQIATYLASGGTRLSDDPCLEDLSCDFIPQLSVEE